LPQNKWIVFSPRTLSKKERIVEIVEGFSALLKKVPRAFLIISEKGALPEYRQLVYDAVDDLEIQDRVKFVTHIPKEKMAQYYRASDVIISNSLWDGMPQTAFEAALCKSVLLLSDLPQYHEYFEDGKSAFYMDGTPESIAEKISYLHNNPEISADIGRQAREVVARKADIVKWSGIFIQEMEKVISSGNKIEIPWYKLLTGKAVLFFIIIFRRFPFSTMKVKV